MIDPKFLISNVQNDWKYILEKKLKNFILLPLWLPLTLVKKKKTIKA